jgi:hypothetical protein
MELTDLDHKNFNSHVGKTFISCALTTTTIIEQFILREIHSPTHYNHSSPIQFMVQLRV